MVIWIRSVFEVSRLVTSLSVDSEKLLAGPHSLPNRDSEVEETSL